jgi:hypothetical protein
MSYEYHSGQAAIPPSGAAVPVCTVGGNGCLVVASNTAWIGGPDVTLNNGVPLQANVAVVVPCTVVMPPGTLETEPEPLPILYACTSKASVEVAWLSGQLPSF